MIDLKTLTIAKALSSLRKGDFTSEELTRSYLDQIEKDNKRLNIYLEVYDDALESAKARDKERSEGKVGLLQGIPLALKDNMLVDGKISSSASKMLENYRATYTGTVPEKLLGEGSVFLGRVNMDEFAMGSTTENSAFGPTLNPVDETRVPGGTSGGSAASVKANLALASLGSDTGGSIRQPGAFCGVVGFKPTYGAVSRNGLMAMTSSFDQIGPLTKTVEDTRILFDVIRGEDPMDMTSIPNTLWNKDVVRPIESLKGLKVGVPFNFVEREGIDPDVLESFKNTLSLIEAEGGEIINVELPLTHLSLPVYYIIVFAEISSNLGRYDGVKYGLHVDGENEIDDYFLTRAEGFGSEVRRRIILGTYVLSSGYYDSYYGKARAVRGAIKKEFRDAFKNVDLIALPTTPKPAFKKGEKTSDPLSMYLEDIFTVPANIAGLPSLSIPTDTVERDGVALPLGFQLMGPRMGDYNVLKAGELIEALYQK